jgi:hypothetical protein
VLAEKLKFPVPSNWLVSSLAQLLAWVKSLIVPSETWLKTVAGGRQ